MFNDGDISRILMDATSHPAGAFGARHTPGIMRTIEIMTMHMARKWGVCTLNEFRKSLGLKGEHCLFVDDNVDTVKAYTSFQEWNPDPAIWVRIQLFLRIVVDNTVRCLRKRYTSKWTGSSSTLAYRQRIPSRPVLALVCAQDTQSPGPFSQVRILSLFL